MSSPGGTPVVPIGCQAALSPRKGGLLWASRGRSDSSRRWHRLDIGQLAGRPSPQVAETLAAVARSVRGFTRLVAAVEGLCVR